MIRRTLGARALGAETVTEAERRAVIEGRLPVRGWPSRDLRVTAVNALTCDLRVFDRDSRIGLVNAVAASCAVPMIWPPVTIGGSRHVDGGVRSVNNLSLAAGYERVLLMAPMEDPGWQPRSRRWRAPAGASGWSPRTTGLSVPGSVRR